MNIIGINDNNSTSSYSIKINNTYLEINSEKVTAHCMIKDNTLTIISDFLKSVNNTTFIKCILNLDTTLNILLEKSYIIKGDILDNTYSETSRDILVDKAYYNILEKNFINYFGNKKLLHDFLKIVPFKEINYILNTGPTEETEDTENAEIKYVDLNNRHSIYINDLRDYHQCLIKSIFSKAYVIDNQSDAQIVVNYGENNIEYLNNQIVLTISENFYLGGQDMLKSTDSINNLLLENEFKEIKINLPKIEKPAGCCGGGACGKTKEECCNNKVDSQTSDKEGCDKKECCNKETKLETEPEHKCCQNKHDSECCKKNKEIECDCDSESCKKECNKESNNTESNNAAYGFLLYMKGTKEEPKCKYSRAAIEKLDSVSLNYNTYNVLENPDLRERLKKTHSTFPQLWYKYKFVCGGDTLDDYDNLSKLCQYLEDTKTQFEFSKMKVL